VKGRAALAPFLLFAAATTASGSCVRRPVANRNIIVASLTSGPNNLDPRVGTDDASQKIHTLIFDNLVSLDEHLRIVPKLAERLEHPDPLTYIAILRRGVRFHDGRPFTAEDVVYTFRCMLDPSFLSAKKGGYRELESVEARDPYTVVFKLSRPFESFPMNLNVLPIVPNGAGQDMRDRPVGTGPYRFVRYDVDESVELAAYSDYYAGRPKNDGVILRIVPDEVMRGLELRKGTLDIFVNDVSPDIVAQLRHEPELQIVEAPGVDYQYIGLNLQDPALRDVRVRRALAYAIDRQAIVDHLRRGLAAPAIGILPPASWAFAGDAFSFPHDPARAAALLDEAGFADPDDRGPRPRLRLTLKVSNIEYNRLQSSVIQQDLHAIGVALDVRTYEFATLYEDVLAGNFQLFTLQWTGGALVDPDILRRVFHSRQAPPAGFNRGRFSDPDVDALLDRASASLDERERLELYQEVQRRVALAVPYVSLWYKTNVAVARRSLTGVHLSPLADLDFLKDVARIPTPAN
jgi:peptide/nickel transport system substrate-binding protein